MKSIKLIISFVVILGVNIGALYLFTAPPQSEEQPELPAVEENPAVDTIAMARLSADEAQANMNRWVFALLRDNVTFDEIESIHQQYEANLDAYRQYCDEKDCKKVEDYHSVKNLIFYGCFDELEKINVFNWNLSEAHRKMVERATHNHNTHAKEWFMEHYTEYKSFADMTVPGTTANIEANAVHEELNKDQKQPVKQSASKKERDNESKVSQNASPNPFHER